MEIQGLGSSPLSNAPEKSIQSGPKSGFGQMLIKLANKNNSKLNMSASNTEEPKTADDILAFLKNANIEDLANGKQEMDANSQTDGLKMVKNLLGISDEKWSEIVSELESATKQKLKDQDPISMFIEGLSFLTMNPSIAGLNENMVQFVKAAKAYSLLPNQNEIGQQCLSGLLDSLKDQLQGVVVNGQGTSKFAFLQNTFSKAISDLNGQTASSADANRLKAVDRLTEINANSPFLQQMSKPEQLLVMGGGTTKSVSVNDLIQQFESILSKSQFSKMGGVQKLFIKLNPEHLGSISIELIRKDQGLTAKILTTTEAAKEALETHLHSLKHAFEAQSIKVDNLEVGQQSSQQQDDFLNSGQSDQQENPQDSWQEMEHEDEDTDSSFILTLEEAILNQEA